VRELLDFDVAIEPFGDGYRARVVGSPVGEAYADFAFPFTDDDLTILTLRVIGSIGRARRKVRRIQSEERRLLEDFGDRLFQAVFSGPVGECLGRSRLVADGRDAGLRIRLRLPGALANIPWEYLHETGYGFVGLSPETVLVRYLEMPAPVRPFPISPPLRILAMISAPADVPGLEGEEEWGKLTGALDDLIRGGLVQVDRLESGTLAALQRPLRLRDYHVLHFIGHGGYDEDAQDGALALEGAGRQTRLVTGRDLGLMIRDHRSLRLVVLNACEGARSARDDPFGGVAQALVRQGIPAVIAMQFEISDPAALIFSQSFYQAIADGLPVDVATLEARRSMFADGNEVEWATPVLYLRSPDGRIFTRTPISPAARQAREETEQRARELADHYLLACAAADAQDWDQALTAFTMIADIDPGYRDVAARLGECSRRRDIAALQEQLLALFTAGEFQAVTGIADQLAELDPAAADPDGLATQARHRVRQHTTPPPNTGPGQHSRPSSDTAAAPVPGLAHTLTGHGGGWLNRLVTSVAFSPDGRLLASGGGDKTVRLWDPATGEHQRALVGHTSQVQALAFSPDGRLLASGSWDHTVRLWDLATGEHQRTRRIRKGHANYVTAVAFSPDGRLLASSSWDKTVRLWDPATLEYRRTLTGHTDYVHAVAFSSDGRLLASGSDDKTVRLWDPATLDYRRTLTGHTRQVLAVAFSPDGRLLASSSWDKTVRLWDPGTGEHRRTLTGHTSYILAVAFSPDGRLLASGSDDKTVRLWDPATGEHQRTLTGHTGPVRAVAFSPDGRLLASGGHDNTVRLWDLTQANR
jgi:hypothetical protein